MAVDTGAWAPGPSLPPSSANRSEPIGCGVNLDGHGKSCFFFDNSSFACVDWGNGGEWTEVSSQLRFAGRGYACAFYEVGSCVQHAITHLS